MTFKNGDGKGNTTRQFFFDQHMIHSEIYLQAFVLNYEENEKHS